MFILKEIIQNLLLGIPAIRHFAWKWHTTGINNNQVKVDELWAQITSVTSTNRKNVLEIGPGRTDALLYLAKSEASKAVFALDVYPYLDVTKLSVDDIDYKVYNGKKMPYPENFIDLIWSNDTFEHLKHPQITVAEINRILSSGGIAIINIDLSDHYSQGKAEILLFNCLKYPDWLWKIMTSNRSAFVNRIRYSGWMEMFKANGFNIIQEEPVQSAIIKDAYKRKLIPYLQNLAEEDAVTKYLTVVLKKPESD
jgi:ubiquinone/menaquinone biosynthesis C-methylase UbiE